MCQVIALDGEMAETFGGLMEMVEPGEEVSLYGRMPSDDECLCGVDAEDTARINGWRLERPEGGYPDVALFRP